MNVENVFTIFCPGATMPPTSHLRAMARDLVPVLGKPAQMTFIFFALEPECVDTVKLIQSTQVQVGESVKFTL